MLWIHYFLILNRIIKTRNILIVKQTEKQFQYEFFFFLLTLLGADQTHKNIQVEFSLKTGTSTPLFNTRKNHNSDTTTILQLF
jgi:hypothetical protein